MEDPAFVERACWWELPGQLPDDLTITCGTVQVPADRTDPASEMLNLAVARVHRRRANPGEPPIVRLPGGPLYHGPGVGALDAPPLLSALPLEALDERDLILYDPRGTGRSTPDLNCPEMEAASLQVLSAAGSWAEELATTKAAAVACRQRLVSQGIDLDDYDTPASVEDLETIRKAMDINTWNVTGGVYGTRLGLAYARAHPEAIRSLLLDSVYPPEVGGSDRNRALPDAAIARLDAACAAQPSCLAANGHVSEHLATAVASLDAHPEPISMHVWVDGHDTERRFLLTGADAKAAILAAMENSGIVPGLPQRIKELAEGYRHGLRGFLVFLGTMWRTSEGAFLSVECADSQRAHTPVGPGGVPPDPGSNATVALRNAEALCPAWDVADVPAEFAEPVDAAVTTLVFAATLDPVTPYAESKAQAERMPNARLVTVPGGGPGAADTHDCTEAARDAFWHDPTADLPSCLADLAMVPFFPW